MKSTGERCYYPNTRLITLPVVNLTRSCARSEKVVISLNVGQASNAAREALLVSHAAAACAGHTLVVLLCWLSCWLLACCMAAHAVWPSVALRVGLTMFLKHLVMPLLVCMCAAGCCEGSL